MSKTCKHNRMTEVLPLLWIGGTKKHTQYFNTSFTYGWKTKNIAVVEAEPAKKAPHTRYFVCPNYGTPSVDTSWWANEISRYRQASATPTITVVTDLGGHGRSGLYCAIIMAHVLGTTGSEAIFRLRQMHCEQAVETAEQEAYVARIVDELRNWKG